MLILHPYRICQYNCISLGLTVGAVAAVLSNKELVACFLFSLALNHKQVLYNGDLRASCSIPNEFIGSTNELIYILSFTSLLPAYLSLVHVLLRFSADGRLFCTCIFQPSLW